MDGVLISGFVAAMVRVSTPLLLAATGELVAERAGVINIGIEGAMLAGALGGAVGASESGLALGVVTAMVAGLLVAVLFAAVTLGARADQIISGTAVSLAAVGFTGVLNRRIFGPAGSGLTLPTFPDLAIPGLSALPVIGRGLFTQPLPTYLAWGLVPLTWWLLFRTRAGLELRATGESRSAARAAGVRVGRVQLLAVLAGGAMAGLGGGSLVLAQVGTFAEQMTAGRGFIAIAIVVLGRWHPGWVFASSLLFGGATALQFLFQAMALHVPYQLFLMLPYALALVALTGGLGRARAPAELGKTPADPAL